MNTEIKVPELPESVADAVIANWYKQVGEAINMDEVLVDLETDKVILEVPAVKQGVVKEILFSVGDIVTAGQLLAIIDESGSLPEAAEQNKKTETVSKAPAAMSPSVRKVMAENAIDESQIIGSGKGGRIIKQDVVGFLANKGADEAPVAARDVQPAKQAAKQANTPAITEPQNVGERLERRVPMTRLRSRIAERLLQSQQQSAILTTFNEVNMKPVMELRARHKEAFEKKFGVRLGFMSFFLRASVEALKRFPEVNASIDGNDIVYHGYFDIGVAVSGPSGLVVPIIRDVDTQSIADIEQSIVNYAVKARENSLSINDITGGTFTVTNGGVFGSMLSTPIINPPQSGILGMHNITERAMVVDGEVQVLPMMYLALTYDHRMIDGREAVGFLGRIKQFVQDPTQLLLGL